MANEPTLTFLHCKKCLEALPSGESPKTYARIEVGITSNQNVLVWCVRHDMEIATLTPEIIKDIAEHPNCEECEDKNDKLH